MPPLRDSGSGPEAERPEYAGQYRLEARLGSGGMGVVHLARSSSGLLLAVKVVHAEFAQDPEFRGRFRQEVAAARRVSGAFTAPVVDADPDAERPWMATLHIAGPTLSAHVKRNGPLAPAEVRQLGAGLAEALRDIHRAGVVHRDLKPGNVLLAADGPKVIDFGISRPNDSEMRTETGKLIGTPPFMAPEQFQRPREVGPAADVFALGSVLVHAATGRGPFDSESPYLVAYQVVHDEAELSGVPDALVPLVESCLAKDPADRPTPDRLMQLLRTDAPMTLPADVASPGEALPETVTGTRIPAPRQPVRAESTPPRAETTHVRARTPDVSRNPDVPRIADPSRTANPSRVPHPSPVPDLSRAPAAPSARPSAPPTPQAAPGKAAWEAAGRNPERAPERDSERDSGRDAGRAPGPASGNGRRKSPRKARRLRWAATALAATAAVAVAATWAYTSLAGSSANDPALQTHAPRVPRTAFHPWRTTIVERPAGHNAEMPYCTAGADAVFCGQSGMPAARLSPGTGEVAWRHKGAPAGPEAVSPTAPVLSGGFLYVFTADGKRLLALDPSPHGNGALRWSLDVSPYEGGAAVVGDRILLIAADGTLTALDTTTHTQRWRKRFPGHRLPHFTTYGDPHTAYAAETLTTGPTPTTQLTAINPSDGAVRWSHRLPGTLTLAGPTTTGALFLTIGDPTYDGTVSGVLRFDPATRRTRKLPLAAPLHGVFAAVQGDTAYLLAEGGALQAVGARTWDTETSVSRGSAPVISGDRLYFTAADGRLLAVDTTSGAVLGQTPPRLTATRHNGFLQAVPAPTLDAAQGHIYAASPDGTVFGVATADPARW
ncbi:MULTISPECIES: PQQ-binding-like beta-propeller repeat protein [unclassified Streptomyces]|uniref:protein kinase domain-containing protein n=1 Tax=unclassified Streptomyces TaxID=2593676 RepID=UPI00038104EF|nr:MULTISPECIES: PQQ-binding-like beta-propeller repeat protein [unclassified Streptomyces]MYT33530.1 PQQ-binding-like beta-propeller repeat protein [Streptomyces sp. SID8354]